MFKDFYFLLHIRNECNNIGSNKANRFHVSVKHIFQRIQQRFFKVDLLSWRAGVARDVEVMCARNFLDWISTLLKQKLHFIGKWIDIYGIHFDVVSFKFAQTLTGLANYHYICIQKHAFQGFHYCRACKGVTTMVKSFKNVERALCFSQQEAQLVRARNINKQK